MVDPFYIINDHLAIKLAHLESCSRQQLVDQWIKAYGAPPLKGIRDKSLIFGLAYYLQTKYFTALKPTTAKKLIELAKGDNKGYDKFIKKQSTKDNIPSNSQLIREWQGKSYMVHVSEAGYQMNDITYKSLSAVAKAITGAHWSGPRFFGLTDRKAV